MAVSINYIRRIELTGSYDPTVPGLAADHKSFSWPFNAIYVGEWYINTGSNKIWTRFVDGVQQIYPHISSSYALTASYLLGSVESASYALTSSYALNSLTSSYSLNSLTSSYTQTSLTSSYSITASYLLGSITSASYSLTSSYALNSLSSSHSITSSHALSSLTASYSISSSRSQTASYVQGYMQNSIYDPDNDNLIDRTETIQIFVANVSGSTIPKGKVVFLSGSFTNRNLAWLASAANEQTTRYTLGITTEDIADSTTGSVCIIGSLHDYNLSGFTAGRAVWLHPTSPGEMTMDYPEPPSHSFFLGWISRAHATLGRMIFNPQGGVHMSYLHDVLLNTPQDGDVLVYSNSLWINSGSFPGSSSYSLTSSYSVRSLSSSYSETSSYLNPVTSMTATTGNFGVISQSGKYQHYNNLPLTGNGIGSILAQQDLPLRSASIAATTLYTPNYSGMFQIVFNAKVISAGASSVLGPFQFRYTADDDSVVVTGPSNNTNGINQSNNNASNSAAIGNAYVINAKSGTNIEYIMGYSSTGTAMSYSLHVKLIAL